MTTTTSTFRITTALFTAFLLACFSAVQGATIGNTINIQTGTEITRTWADIQNDSYAYGEKQSVSWDGPASTTDIWLPYGNTDGVYYGLSAISLYDPTSSSHGAIASAVGSHNASLTYHFAFDMPIKTFSFNNDWTQYNLADDGTDTIGMGIEYSLDGTTWITLKEVTSPTSATIEPFYSGTVSDLWTSDLYIQTYSRNLNNLSSTSGSTRYYQMRTVGAQGWGYAGFTDNQWRLQVTTPEPASLTLLGLAGLALLRRKNLGK